MISLSLTDQLAAYKAVEAGKRALIACDSVASRRNEMVDFKHGGRDLEVFGSTATVRHDSGGEAHFVTEDRQVMGREYHAGFGRLTNTMRTRVRL